MSQQNFLYLNTLEIFTHFPRTRSFIFRLKGELFFILVWKLGHKEKRGVLLVVPCIFISKASCYRRCWVRTQATGPQLTLLGIQGELIIDPGSGMALSRHCFWQIYQVNFHTHINNFDKKQTVTLRSKVQPCNSSRWLTELYQVHSFIDLEAVM